MTNNQPRRVLFLIIQRITKSIIPEFDKKNDLNIQSETKPKEIRKTKKLKKQNNNQLMEKTNLKKKDTSTNLSKIKQNNPKRHIFQVYLIYF